MKPYDPEKEHKANKIRKWLMRSPFRRIVRNFERSRFVRWFNLRFRNLPKEIPSDFMLTVTGVQNRVSKSIHYKIEIATKQITVEKSIYELNKSGKTGDLIEKESYQANLSGNDLGKIYGLIRSSGFIHFELDDSAPGSWDVSHMSLIRFYLTARLKKYYFCMGSEYLLHMEWEKEAWAFEEAIQDLAARYRSRAPFKYQPSLASDN